VKPETTAHAEQRKKIVDLIAAQGLDEYRDALTALIKPAIALTSRDATPDDLALGASRIGGEPDLPSGTAWPENDDGPLLFVMQVRLADVAPFDLDEVLPSDGLLSLFTDRFCDDVQVLYTPESPEGGALEARVRPADTEDGPFPACGVDFSPQLQLPPHSSAFVGVEGSADVPGSAARMGSKLCLPKAAYEKYWDHVWIPWLAQRPSSAGSGAHQMLGYAATQDSEQLADDEVLIAFDSDDRAGMEWGDVQCVWTILGRDQLLARSFDAIRAVI
jgi:hypothetical protein